MPESIPSLDLRKPLVGRSAVVTGASSGIGRAIAFELAAAGANVFVHARANQSGAEVTAKLIRAQGAAAEVFLADLGSEVGCDALVQAAFAWRSDISIWVNNAGADVLTGEAAKLSFEEKLQVLWRVDVLATMRLSRAAGAALQQSENGAIVNIGWDQAAWGMAGDSGQMFAAIKGAVMAFSKSLAHSLAPQVRVNCVAPGWIQTSWGQEASGYWQERARGESLLHRWGTPEDIARVVRFLVSPDGNFVNGQVISVNGGFRTSP